MTKGKRDEERPGTRWICRSRTAAGRLGLDADGLGLGVGGLGLDAYLLRCWALDCC